MFGQCFLAKMRTHLDHRLAKIKSHQIYQMFNKFDIF